MNNKEDKIMTKNYTTLCRENGVLKKALSEWINFNNETGSCTLCIINKIRGGIGYCSEHEIQYYKLQEYIKQAKQYI